MSLARKLTLVPSEDGSAHSSQEENSPLISSPVVIEDIESSVVEHIIQHKPTGTILSSTINIANTILGSGMLAMPSAMAAAGLGMGMVLIAFCATASGFGLFLLSRIAAQVGRKSSFFTCASITYPDAAVYFDLAIAVKCFGVSVSYLVILGGLIPNIVGNYFPNVPLESWLRQKESWITISMFIIAPFCFLRRLDSLRYTSAFSLLAVVYLLFVVVGFFIWPLPAMPRMPTFSDIEWIKFDSNTMSHLSIFVFAFTCHQNIFSIHNELANNASTEIDKVIGNSIGISFLVYQTIGIFGYLTFGKNVSSNIIALYPPSNIVTGAQVAIAFLVLFSYPLQCHPCRNSLDKVIPQTEEEAPESHGVNQMAQGRFTLLTFSIMICSYLVAISVSDLSTVLAFVGATGSTTICYILPGLFYYKMIENQRTVNNAPRPFLQIAAMFMVVLGFVVMVTSLGNLFFGSGAAGHK